MRAFLKTIPPRLIMLASFAGTSVVNYAFGLAMGWLLLPGDFGLLAFAQTLLLLAGLLLNSGFAWSLTAGLAHGDPAGRAALVRGTLISNLALAGAASALLLLLFAAGPLRGGLEQWNVALLVAAAVPLLALVAVAQATARGLERFDALATIQLLEVGGKAVGGISLALAGGGVVGAISGFLIGGALAALAGTALVRWLLKMPLVGTVALPSPRAAGAMFGALLGLALLLNLDILALKLLGAGERAAVGHYQAALVLANTPYYLASALLTVLFPQLARLRHLPSSAPAVAETLRLILFFLLPIELLLAAAPGELLGLVFPPAYVAGAPALRLLALGNIALMLLAAFSVAFQATGRAGTPARILMAAAPLELLALWLVVPRLGAVGAAALFSLSCALVLLALGFMYARAIGWDVARQASGWLARYAAAIAAGGALALLLAALGVALPLALVAGLLLYGLSGLALRLVPVPRSLRQWGPLAKWKGKKRAHSSPGL